MSNRATPSFSSRAGPESKGSRVWSTAWERRLSSRSSSSVAFVRARIALYRRASVRWVLMQCRVLCYVSLALALFCGKGAPHAFCSFSHEMDGLSILLLTQPRNSPMTRDLFLATIKSNSGPWSLEMHSFRRATRLGFERAAVDWELGEEKIRCARGFQRAWRKL